MDEFRGNHIPPFGSWDCNNHLPFTECFESARQPGFIGYGYVAGDLYNNNVVTPAMIVVPRRRVDRRKGPVRGSKKVVCEYDYEFMYGGNEDPVPEVVKKKKAVDEDLYKISPELLRAPPMRKSKRWGLFSMCMQPGCVM